MKWIGVGIITIIGEWMLLLSVNSLWINFVMYHTNQRQSSCFHYHVQIFVYTSARICVRIGHSLYLHAAWKRCVVYTNIYPWILKHTECSRDEFLVFFKCVWIKRERKKSLLEKTQKFSWVHSIECVTHHIEAHGRSFFYVAHKA